MLVVTVPSAKCAGTEALLCTEVRISARAFFPQMIANPGKTFGNVAFDKRL